jgi:hypothetical protein
MLINTITDHEDGKKWEIFKGSENNFFYKYYEFFTQCGWGFICDSGNTSKDVIEWEFNIEIN